MAIRFSLGRCGVLVRCGTWNVTLIFFTAYSHKTPQALRASSPFRGALGGASFLFGSAPCPSPATPSALRATSPKRGSALRGGVGSPERGAVTEGD